MVRSIQASGSVESPFPRRNTLRTWEEDANVMDGQRGAIPFKWDAESMPAIKFVVEAVGFLRVTADQEVQPLEMVMLPKAVITGALSIPDWSPE